MANKRATLAAVLIVLLGGSTVLAAKFLWPYATEKYEAYKQAATSDSRVSTTIRIGGDGYLGYWFITAPDTRREAARRGIAIAFQDDGGAYAARLQKFANREYDAIVLPVNSYLQHGCGPQVPRGHRGGDCGVERGRWDRRVCRQVPHRQHPRSQ